MNLARRPSTAGHISTSRRLSSEKKIRLHYSAIEFRPEQTTSTLPVLPLGIAIEFASGGKWVVALLTNAVIPTEDLAKLDPLSRQIIESREEVLKDEIQRSLEIAQAPGDVVAHMAATNTWSVRVMPPQIKEVALPLAEVRRQTAEKLAETVAFKILTSQRECVSAIKSKGVRAMGMAPTHRKVKQKVSSKRVKYAVASSSHQATDSRSDWMRQPSTFVRHLEAA